MLHCNRRCACLREQLPSGEELHQTLDLLAAVKLSRDEQSAFLVQAQRSLIEESVVQDAEAETVVLGVGAFMGDPLDVGRLQTNSGVGQPSVVAADGTTVFVVREDGSAELGGAGGQLGPQQRHGLPGESDRIEDGVVPGGWKMSLEKQRCDLLAQRRILGQQHVDLGAEASRRVLEVTDSGVVRLVGSHTRGACYFPEPSGRVFPQSPEGIFGLLASPRRTVDIEQIGERPANIRKRSKSGSAPLQVGQGHQQ